MKPLSRRTLLRGAGGIGIALPFLDAMSLSGRKAHAQTVAPKRLIVMTGQNGVVPGTWFPSAGGEKDFTLGYSMEPLQPVRDNLIILDGITKMQRGYDQDGTAHGRGHAGAITGQTCSGKNGIGDGPSIDHVVAEAIGEGTRFKSILAGNRNTNYHFFHSGNRSPVTVEPDPRKNFDRLFSNFVAPSPGMGGTAMPETNPAIDRLLGRKKSVLDAALEEYQRVSRVVGAKDKVRLDQHATELRQIEKSLAGLNGGTPGAAGGASQSCAKPAQPNPSDDYENGAPLHLSILAMALACDITRVVGYQFVSHGTVFRWLGITDTDHHPLAHQTGSAGPDMRLSNIVRWHAEQASKLIQQLKSYGEGGGTVLDNTVFMWTNEISRGNHKFDRGPFLLASGRLPLGANKVLETGRYLKLGGHPHTGVLLSVANMMGLPLTSFGFNGWQKGPVPGLI